MSRLFPTNLDATSYEHAERFPQENILEGEVPSGEAEAQNID
jgi:hypothetical protein